jgi:hypothetical protein
MRPRAKLVLKATGFFRDPFWEAPKLKTVPELCFYPSASMHRYVQSNNDAWGRGVHPGSDAEDALCPRFMQQTALFKAF